MPNSVPRIRTRFASTVTGATLAEFALLRKSLESALGGNSWRWSIRCDQAAAGHLGQDPAVECALFPAPLPGPPGRQQAARASWVKSAAIADAWNDPEVEQVIYLDAGIVALREFLTLLDRQDADILLAGGQTELFNCSVIRTRTRGFHIWWKDALTASANSDSPAIESASHSFSTASLPPDTTAGLSKFDTPFGPYPSISGSCAFMRVHFFGRLRSYRDWVEKSFALHCLKFLRESPASHHQELSRAILDYDQAGWYAAALPLA